jgi:NADH-quinone oxidoreductase subunit M
LEKHAGSRELSSLGGIAKYNRLFAALYLIIVLGTTAVPFTNGFPGEFMLLKGVFDYNTITGVFAAITIILCAVYMLRMYQFSMLGETKGDFKTIGISQVWPLILLVALIIIIGISPMLILDKISPAVQKIMLEISNSKGVLS